MSLKKLSSVLYKNTKKYRYFIFKNPGIGIWVKSRYTRIFRYTAGACSSQPYDETSPLKPSHDHSHDDDDVIWQGVWPRRLPADGKIMGTGLPLWNGSAPLGQKAWALNIYHWIYIHVRCQPHFWQHSPVYFQKIPTDTNKLSLLLKRATVSQYINSL